MEKKLENRLLLAQCYKSQTSFQDALFKTPSEYRRFLLDTYPDMKKWATAEIFNQVEDWPDNLQFQVNLDQINVAGHFIAQNIDTPTKVMDVSATPVTILAELEKDSYSHVGLGIFVDSYSDFIDCTKTIRKFDPNIKILAGNVGCMFEGTEKHVDYTCKGRGVPFLRKMFGEEINKPYNLVIIPDHQRITFNGQVTSTNLVRIVSKIGCPNQCDFCVTNKLFNGEFTGFLCSPQQFHDSVVEYRNELGKDFILHFAEPTAVFSLKWWYELFELFEGEVGDYPMYLGGMATSFNRFELEKIKNSSLRFDVINIGVESFNQNYNKNKSVNIKNLIARYQNYGIGVYCTYIIGFDYHTPENVWEDVEKLIDLDALIYGILNLHPLPETPIWERFVAENRLLDVPNDFHYLPGFQSYTHPHFKPGFEDILPIMCEINKYVEKERGNLSLQLYNIKKRLLLIRDNNKRDIRKQARLYQSISKFLYPAWKDYLNPSNQQIENYVKLVS